MSSKNTSINTAATHAPHANHTIQMKNHNGTVRQQMNKWKLHEGNLIFGDFNVLISMAPAHRIRTQIEDTNREVYHADAHGLSTMKGAAKC